MYPVPNAYEAYLSYATVHIWEKGGGNGTTRQGPQALLGAHQTKPGISCHMGLGMLGIRSCAYEEA
jgi:hypothetical protein